MPLLIMFYFLHNQLYMLHSFQLQGIILVYFFLSSLFMQPLKEVTVFEAKIDTITIPTVSLNKL